MTAHMEVIGKETGIWPDNSDKKAIHCDQSSIIHLLSFSFSEFSNTDELGVWNYVKEIIYIISNGKMIYPQVLIEKQKKVYSSLKS